MDEEEEVKRYEQLVEKEKNDKNFHKLPADVIAEEITDMNLNEVTRRNAGSPLFGQSLAKLSPKWAKPIFKLIAAYYVIWIIVLIIAAAVILYKYL